MPQRTSRRIPSGIGVLAVVGALLTTGTYGALTLLAPLEPVSAAVVAHPIAAPSDPHVVFPDYGGSAIAAIGFPDATITHGVETPMQLASITKVITTLVVLEVKPLARDAAGPTLTFGPYDVDRYRYHLHNNGSNEPVWSGLRLSQRDVLEAVLMSSANNYAESLAVWAFGSIDRFVTRANAWLAENGMPDTRIVEPSGLDKGNVATTTDLLALARIAHNNPTIADIVAQQTATASSLGELENSNLLLGVDGIDGIKTGRLDHFNLLFSAELDIDGRGVTVVGVVLGADSKEERDASVRSLVQSTRDGFEERELVAPGTVVGTFSTPWGDEARAVTASGASALAWRGSDTTAHLTLRDIEVGAVGGLVGRLEFVVGQRSITVPVVLEGLIDDPGVWWRLLNPAELLG